MTEQHQTPQLVSTSEAAKILGLSPLTLEEWRRKKKGPPYARLSKKLVRYSTSDLEAWLKGLTVREGVVSKALS